MRAAQPIALASFPVLAVLLLAGCQSPFRGDWSGTFDGTVSGTVSFEINARGTKMRGRMIGKTAQGQDFEAKLEGKLTYGHIDAFFRGSSPSDFGLPIAFEGRMGGELFDDQGSGSWQATLLAGRAAMSGSWAVARVGTALGSSTP